MAETVLAEAPFGRSARALKVPPHSIEAEQSVLGGLLIDNEAWERVAEVVIEQDFYRRDHRMVFAAIHSLADQGRPFDTLTTADWLESQGVLEEAGGLAYLGELARDTPSSANIGAYAEIMRERAVLPRSLPSGYRHRRIGPAKRGQERSGSARSRRAQSVRAGGTGHPGPARLRAHPGGPGQRL